MKSLLSFHKYFLYFGKIVSINFFTNIIFILLLFFVFKIISLSYKVSIN